MYAIRSYYADNEPQQCIDHLPGLCRTDRYAGLLNDPEVDYRLVVFGDALFLDLNLQRVIKLPVRFQFPVQGLVLDEILVDPSYNFV